MYMKKDSKDIFSYAVTFYNGGTSLTEVLADLLKKVDK
jgi:hypothetical protein